VRGGMGIKQKSVSRLRTFFQYRELFFQLVSRNIKLKYRRSLLGYFWSVLSPLLTMVIMAAVFSTMLARGIENFPVYLLSGQILFAFMNGAAIRAISSVLGSAAIIKKIYVPKYIFTLAAVTTELVIMLFSLGALAIVVVATGLNPSWHILLVFVPVIELYIFCIGLGFLLAQAMVFFRDVQYIWSVFSTAWMYLTPIFYPVTMLPEPIRFIVTNFNPMYYYIAQFRYSLLGGDDKWAECVFRGAVAMVIMFLIGIKTFSQSKNKFILYI
jgi:lipopolysaccharide transport system permease protein